MRKSLYQIAKYNIMDLGLSIPRYWAVYHISLGPGYPIKLFRTKKEAIRYKKLCIRDT